MSIIQGCGPTHAVSVRFEESWQLAPVPDRVPAVALIDGPKVRGVLSRPPECNAARFSGRRGQTIQRDEYGPGGSERDYTRQSSWADRCDGDLPRLPERGEVAHLNRRGETQREETNLQQLGPICRKNLTEGDVCDSQSGIDRDGQSTQLPATQDHHPNQNQAASAKRQQRRHGYGEPSREQAGGSINHGSPDRDGLKQGHCDKCPEGTRLHQGRRRATPHGWIGQNAQTDQEPGRILRWQHQREVRQKVCQPLRARNELEV